LSIQKNATIKAASAFLIARECIILYEFYKISWVKAFMGTPNHIEIKQLPTLSERRRELTKEYCRIHYGYDGFQIQDPKMIVVHYTAFESLSESYDCIKPDALPSVREDIKAGGALNVGTHYLIDRNGDIYQLLPDDMVARHTIGFNHTALSLENVGRDRDHLTEAQVSANASLVRHLVQKYPSIEYRIGHY